MKFLQKFLKQKIVQMNFPKWSSLESPLLDSPIQKSIEIIVAAIKTKIKGRKLLPFPGAGPQTPIPQSRVLVEGVQWAPEVLVQAPVQGSYASYQNFSLTLVMNLRESKRLPVIVRYNFKILMI